ncbi:MAG: hypothetical protein AAF944_24485 [Bacteroidota bacterium]
MKQPIATKPEPTKQPPSENQQNLDRYYWELNRCLRDEPDRQPAPSLTGATVSC